VALPIVLAVVGFIVVIGITAISERVAHRSDADLAAELGEN
jgi:hypothetical protein